MNVVDSSAWLSYFAGDTNSHLFAKPIEDMARLLVPSITIIEVFKNVLRQSSEASALIAIAHMRQGKVLALDAELALSAALWGIELKLPLADSIIYATARKYNAIIWTQDADFKGLESVEFHPKAQR